MEKRRALRRLRFLLPFAAACAAFAALVNLAGAEKLPAALQRPLDAANEAAGGLFYRPAGLTVEFIDVGQGDSALLLCGGKSMLIDGGKPSEASAVESALLQAGVARLDYALGTHPDDDHIGGLADVLRRFGAKTVLFPPVAGDTDAYRAFAAAANACGGITHVRAGFSGTLGGAAFRLEGPLRTYKDDNDMSLVLRLTYGGRAFLFTGDASAAAETDMLAAHENLRADVLKAGHHGSATATSPAFLKAVAPQYAVLSVGAGNSYGLPNRSVTQELTEAGVSILRTDLDGTVTFWTDGKTLRVRTENRRAAAG